MLGVENELYCPGISFSHLEHHRYDSSAPIVRGLMLLVYVLDRAIHLIQKLAIDRSRNTFLVPKMVIDGADAQARSTHNVMYRGIEVPFLAEKSQRRLVDQRDHHRTNDRLDRHRKK